MKPNLRFLISAVVFGSIIGACGSDPNDAADAPRDEITGSVNEWAVEVNATIVRTGVVTFAITNEGTIGHEFLVVKTDFAEGEIPLDGDHFAEPSTGVEVIDEIGEFPVGETNTLTVTLRPGNYQLVCNLPAHYAAGMYQSFNVVE